MVVVVMGVAGAGKTTVGQALATALGWGFLDADSLHPAANVEKMRQGVPLTDADRAAWLAEVHTRMAEAELERRGLVVACSALKRSYRAVLAGRLRVTWIYLTGAPDLIRARLETRAGHFLAPQLLRSQLDTLEPPEEAIVLDVSPPPEVVVARALDALERRTGGPPS